MDRPHYQFWPRRLPRALTVPATSLWDNLAISARRYPAKAAVVFFGRSYAYAELQRLTVEWTLVCLIDHGQAKAHCVDGLLGGIAGQAANGHVAIADGLDLLQVSFRDQFVKGREQSAEHLDELARFEASGKRSEAHDVGEQH